jgi:hypothetical protein
MGPHISFEIVRCHFLLLVMVFSNLSLQTRRGRISPQAPTLNDDDDDDDDDNNNNNNNITNTQCTTHDACKTEHKRDILDGRKLIAERSR